MAEQHSEELFEKSSAPDDHEKMFDEPEEEITEKIIEGEKGAEKWKVLVVDDEEDIHLVTRMALKGFTYMGKGIEFLGTYSGKGSYKVLRENPDIAVILLDVVMETNTAGLELVKYIREKLNYRYTQIVLRTGHPGYAPEREVIVTYEINDYKTKTELTSFKLFTLMLSSLRAYNAITGLDSLRSKLEENVKERTVELEQKSLQIMESEQLKTRFFNNVSHEFRTPLTLILGPLEDMISGRKKDDPDYIRLDRMYRNAQRLLGLVNQLMDLSKLDTSNMKLELKEGDLPGYLRSVLMAFTPLAEKSQVKFSYTLPGELYNIFFDEDKLEKILTNLLSNAFRFTPANGQVDCVVTIMDDVAGKNSPLLVISVSDTGKGIPPGQVEKIFDRFYQVEEQIGEGGTGIGLSLTNELVSLHHGHIKVESEPGQGSRFTVSLPIGTDHLADNEFIILKVEKEERTKYKTERVVENTEGSFSESQIPELSDKKPIIIVAEDHRDVRDHISENLQVEFNVVEVSNGMECLGKSVEIIPDLIVTDLMMPVMDGIEMCNALKTDERTSHIPVIMLTAKANIESRIEGIETGADDYITKPFNMKELKARIKNLVEQRTKLRERYRTEVILEQGEVSFGSADEKFLNRAILVIENHMGDFEFNALTFQKEMGMSRSQLFRKLKALLDQSATEFIRAIRLKRAAMMLKQRYGNVAEVAYEVGFNNLSYFSRCFKKTYSILPSEYIKTRSTS